MVWLRSKHRDTNPNVPAWLHVIRRRAPANVKVQPSIEWINQFLLSRECSVSAGTFVRAVSGGTLHGTYNQLMKLTPGPTGSPATFTTSRVDGQGKLSKAPSTAGSVWHQNQEKHLERHLPTFRCGGSFQRILLRMHTGMFREWVPPDRVMSSII